MNRLTSGQGNDASHGKMRELGAGTRTQAAFTMLELMIVCAIMGLILAAGIPAFSKMLKREGMRKVTGDIEEVCFQARKLAIFSGHRVAVVFHPRDRRLEVESAGSASTDGSAIPVSDKLQTATIPEDYFIEMLDINLWEYNESEWAKVYFYPNGTSDEMTLVLRTTKNEWTKISTEITTGLTSVGDVVR